MSDLSSAQVLLENTKLADICRQQQIVLLEHNQTVGEALKTLANNQILSAPMVSRARGAAAAATLPLLLCNSIAATLPLSRAAAVPSLLQVISPDIEEVQGGDTSPQLLGWIDVADVLRAFCWHCTGWSIAPPTSATLPLAANTRACPSSLVLCRLWQGEFQFPHCVRARRSWPAPLALTDTPVVCLADVCPRCPCPAAVVCLQIVEEHIHRVYVVNNSDTQLTMVVDAGKPGVTPGWGGGIAPYGRGVTSQHCCQVDSQPIAAH